MFRTTVMRAARLPRAVSVSSSLASGARLAVLRSGAAPVQAAMQPMAGRAVPMLSTIARFRRSYSTEVETEEDAGLVTKFADLTSLGVHPNVIDGLVRGMGYTDMTAVQSKSIVPALAGKDVVAQAKTGTGKTLAFLIPLIQRIINDNPELSARSPTRASPDDIRAIIMSPTRELAEQIGKEARKVVQGTGLIVQTAVGGTQKNRMLQELRYRGCHILVATPGRLNDLLSSREIAAPRLAALVLDEADRMLDVGFSRELEQIVSYLPNRKEVPRQTLMFSATVPRDVISLARTYIDGKNFEFVQTVDPNEALTHERIPQNVVTTRGYENIYPAILELIEREVQACKEDPTKAPFKPILFLPTTHMVRLTTGVFNELRRHHPAVPTVYSIHSKLTQGGRTHAAESFRREKSAVLVSSDVTARGMDFPGVTHVIQVGVPPDREQYVHRLGRTGRAGKDGEGWVIAAESELNALRRVLVDLPIKRRDDLASATFDFAHRDSPDAPKHVQSVTTVMKDAPGALLAETYMSLFGGPALGRSLDALAEALSDWAVKGWGWDSAPAMTRLKAQRIGVGRSRAINFGEDPPQITQGKRNFGNADEYAQNRDGGRGGFGGRDGGRGFGGGGFGGRGGGGRDGGRGFGGRDGGFGGRGGGGGFGGRGGGGGGGFGGRGGGGGGFGGRDGGRGFGGRDGGRGGGRDGGRGGGRGFGGRDGGRDSGPRASF